MKYWIMIAALSFPLAACGGETETAETETAETETAETETAETTETDATDEESASAEELPVEEDFEEEAETDISEDNYEAILAELEAELPEEE